MESLLSYLETPIKKKRFLFCLKEIFFVRFMDCPYFLNTALDKIYIERNKVYIMAYGFFRAEYIAPQKSSRPDNRYEHYWCFLQK